MTDGNGMVSANGRGSDSVGVVVVRAGYYSARIERLLKDRDHNLEVVLPRIKAPTPLYAVSDIGARFPVQDEWVGFDFEAADWVAPHGKGKVTDIRFRFRNKFLGWKEHVYEFGAPEVYIEKTKSFYEKQGREWTLDGLKRTAGKWDSVLDVSFSGADEGMQAVGKFLSYSMMKMPHFAPMNGYAATWRCQANNYDGLVRSADTGFFIRTRVKLNEKGDVVSANYAKIMGDFHVGSAAGFVRFTYYFNPVPNDRNLEFDPNRNLFPKSMPGADVREP